MIQFHIMMGGTYLLMRESITPNTLLKFRKRSFLAMMFSEIFTEMITTPSNCENSKISTLLVSSSVKYSGK